VLRHCASGRPTGLERRGRIELDRSVYEIGQAVRIRARLLDAGFRPLRAEALELSARWDAGGEESVPRMASPVMQRLARMTGGRYLSPSEFGQFVRGLPDRSRTVVEPGPLEPLWDTPYLLALLVAALGAEWALRKRMGLL